MPDNDQTNTNPATTPDSVAPDTPVAPEQSAAADAPASDVVVQPDDPSAAKKAAKAEETRRPHDDTPVISDIISRITEAHNILIALSSDPSVDELSAAIGLSLALDRSGKRATAIYSGRTPNVIGFLKPEKTFETTADTLQDFVISVNKDKADHLRYKLDGDFVRIFITPYKTRVSNDDLDFSYGDFNIDLVLALDVANGTDLDNALREHGRIMHDATVVNITTGNPGKFGEIEWSDKAASSISEMAARLLLAMGNELTIEKDDATALLTGIVAATDHFSNTQTTPASMRIASELLKLGANQQLISKHITGKTDNNTPDAPAEGKKTNQDPAANSDSAEPEPEEDPSSLEIEHEPDQPDEESDTTDDSNEETPATPELTPETPTATKPILDTPADLVEPSASAPKIDDNPSSEAAIEPATPESTAEPTFGVTPAATPEVTPEGVATATDEPILHSQGITLAAPESMTTPVTPEVPAAPEFSVPDFTTPEPSAATPVLTSAPSDDLTATTPRDYGQMLEDALAEATPLQPAAPVISPQDVNAMLSPNTTATPVATPIFSTPMDTAAPITSTASMPATSHVAEFGNPAAGLAPTVPATPEINGVPEMNYNATGDILPPPPTPSVIDTGMPPMNMTAAPDTAMSPVGANMSAPNATPMPGVTTSMPDIATPVSDAGVLPNAPVSSSAFQIPGM